MSSLYKGRTPGYQRRHTEHRVAATLQCAFRQILQDIGIDLDKYKAENAKNRSLYTSLGLKPSYFFDKETWGNDSAGGRRL